MRLDDPELIEIDLVVKVKTQARRVYTLPSEEIEETQFRERHSALLRAYRRQDWAADRADPDRSPAAELGWSFYS